MTIDLRSDTVTRPTPAMLDAMLRAEVGDDVFGEDPTVNALQQKVAALFGKDAALFCPSGTMTNQLAIRVHVQPGDEVICSEFAHVYLYEGGGIASNSGASVRLLPGATGLYTAAQVEAAVNARNDAHRPWSRLVVVENTSNRGGGACWDLAELRRIREVCTRHGLAFHLDGARLFNALVARGGTPAEYGAIFDTISICLSKGLGAPVGSLLIGSRDQIAKAQRFRKAFGGGMRQAGHLAAAGIHALDHHVRRLADDHAHAQAVAHELQRLPWVAAVLPAETNIVIFTVADGLEPAVVLQHLADHGVRALSMGGGTVRLVFHLHVDDAATERVIAALEAFRAPRG